MLFPGITCLLIVVVQGDGALGLQCATKKATGWLEDKLENIFVQCPMPLMGSEKSFCCYTEDYTRFACCDFTTFILQSPLGWFYIKCIILTLATMALLYLFLSLTSEDKLKLESWGLPKFILQKYSSKGLHSMFPWQLECLTSGNVLEGGNLVYSAPTSAGKTLIAEILTFQTVLERKKKVIIILPFVSVVREKMLYFQDLLVGSGIRVEGFMGSYNPPGGFRAVHVAICTIEKANSLINRLLEENNFDNIGCVVVDELHLLGDPHRGYLLELLLTKLKYISKKGLCSPIQIVGMSATLPNLDVLARWLDATLYKTDFRPIPLIEYVKIDRTVYKAPDLVSSESFVPEFSIDNDPGDAIYLCIDTIIKGYSVLVFCPTKSWCESLALQIAGEVKRLGCSNNELALELRRQLNSEAISDTLVQLKNSPVGLESVLGRCISFGVAYHHAGLTLDERDIIEGGFRRSVLRVLIATSTLSSGVNLPARRVIIRSPLFNGRLMDILSYKQMVGRAGRMGRDTAGESFLLCTDDNKSQGRQLVTSELPSVESCLGNTDLSNSLKRAILEVIACGLISSYKEVECYTNCTLLAAYENSDKINQAVQKCIKYLSGKGFINVRDETEIRASALAEACLSASMTPDQGLALLAELDKARKCFDLESDLHAVYQVTPFSVSSQWSLDWMKAFSMWEALPKNMQKIGHLVGVEERFLIRAMRGDLNFQGDTQGNKIAIHKRFFTALALQDLINEIPLNNVAEKYGCNKGVLQSLQQSASTFSGMVTNFCRKLSWGALEVVVSQLGQRIQFGAHRDLLDLLRLECMTGAMARSLHNSGVTTVSELARSTEKQVSTAIRKSLPYSGSEDLGNRKEKHDIYLPGRPGLTELEASRLFIKEARTFLMREMGVDHVDWNDPKSSDDAHETTTIGPESKSKVDNSQDFSLSLSVASADFENLMKHEDFQIGVQGKSAPASSPIPTQNEKTLENEDANKPNENCTLESSKDKKNNVLRNNEEDRDEKETKDCDNQEEDEEEGKNLKFSSLLDISNPCIPKMDRSLMSCSSSSDAEEQDEVLTEDILVPASQEMLPSQFNLHNQSGFGVDPFNKSKLVDADKREEFVDGKNATDYNNLHFSNFSKVFGETFSRDSPARVQTLVNRRLNPTIKSSTPFHTPELSTSKNAEVRKLGNISSVLGLNTSKSESPFRTPERRCSAIKDNVFASASESKASPAVSELSDADMFGDSKAVDCRLSSSMICAIHSDQPLEEFDSNWGGDSLLLASQVIESCKDSSLSRNSLKRNLEDSGEYSRKLPTKKHCGLSVQKASTKENDSKKTSISAFFTESLVLDTQAIKVVDYDTSPLALLPAEAKNIETVKSPSAVDRFERNPGRSSFTDSFLAQAFQDSFKNSDENPKAEPGTPDMFDSPMNNTVVNKGLLNNFPIGLVSLGSEMAPNIHKEKLLAQQSFESSPKKVKTQPLVSPSKYPAVGVSFIKFAKSPGSPSEGRKMSSLNPRANSVATSCKKLLLVPPPADTDEDPSKELLMAEALPAVDGPSGSKRFKKAKSETWGKHSIAPTVKDMITSESPEIGSAPVASEVLDVPDFPQNGRFLKANNIANVCESRQKVNDFSKKFFGSKEAAFYLETTNCMSEGNRIGMKIIHSKTREKNPDFIFNNVAIVGIYFFMGDDIFHCCLRSSKCICLDLLKSIFQTKDVTIIGFDLPWQVKLLHQCCEFVIECKLWDVSVADWLLNPQDGKNSLTHLSKEFLRPEEISHANLQKTQCAADTAMVWALKKRLSVKLQEQELLKPFTDTEMPIRLLLVYMELSGMPFDQNIASQLWNRVREMMSQLEEQIFVKARRKFNLSSRKDLKKVKESLNIKHDEQQHPLLLSIHNWRKLNSLKTRNLSNLLMTQLTADGRCRGSCCSFTVTGRIVMHEPNLQHIPRDFLVNDEIFSLRSAFVAKSGNVILSADYSQLELRILAHLSQDVDLLSSIHNEADVFVSIAAKWNNIPLDKVTDDIRHQTKQIIYGIIYGMGDRALGDALGVDPPEAAMLASKFRQSYPGVQRFIQTCISDCRKLGHITTLTGRLRRLKGINSPNKSLRAQAERQAVNSTIQGSAADIAKSATVRVEARLAAAIPNRGPVLTPLSASHLILHLHDELMYEVSAKYVEIVKEIIKAEMTNAVKLKVPLPVVMKCGPSWGQLKKV